jgi:hypothetical protein
LAAVKIAALVESSAEMASAVGAFSAAAAAANCTRALRTFAPAGIIAFAKRSPTISAPRSRSIPFSVIVTPACSTSSALAATRLVVGWPQTQPQL